MMQQHHQTQTNNNNNTMQHPSNMNINAPIYHQQNINMGNTNIETGTDNNISKTPVINSNIPQQQNNFNK